MFDGTLGYYTGAVYKTELLERAQPYHTKPFPIPKVYKETLKTKVLRLVNICVLKCSLHLLFLKRMELFVLFLI